MDKKDFDLIFYRTYSDALMPYNFMNSVFKNIDGKSGVLANDKVLSEKLDAYPKRLTVMSNNRQWMISLNILIVVIMVCQLLIQMKHL